MTTTPQQRIEGDLKTAMKARETERVATLRMLLTMMKNRRIELGTELGEDDLLGLVRKAIKQRQESAEQYRKGNRPELAEREEEQIGFLEPYLPQAPSDDEIRQAIEEFIAAESLSGPKAMGPVMKAMIARFGGAADPGQISKIARGLLQ